MWWWKGCNAHWPLIAFDISSYNTQWKKSATNSLRWLPVDTLNCTDGTLLRSSSTSLRSKPSIHSWMAPGFFGGAGSISWVYMGLDGPHATAPGHWAPLHLHLGPAKTLQPAPQGVGSSRGLPLGCQTRFDYNNNKQVCNVHQLTLLWNIRHWRILWGPRAQI